MYTLPAASRRRLMKLPQSPVTWEGGYQTLPGGVQTGTEAVRSCILWADHSQGMVRAAELTETLPDAESITRILIQAMEHPQAPSRPARPQRIIVQDRELQFFLRGALQELEIKVDYAADLPLLNDIFQGLMGFLQVPEEETPYLTDLETLAEKLWNQAPWQHLADHEILTIELNQWELGTLYASLMGNAGMEFGVLLYRSLESLKQFRQHAMRQTEMSLEQMQAAFMRQDCLFLNFDEDEDHLSPIGRFPLHPPNMLPSFGSIHPLEGARPFLYEEESLACYVALSALSQFCQRHRAALAKGFPSLKGEFSISLPKTIKTGLASIKVKVATQPALAAEFEAGFSEFEEEEDGVSWLNPDLIPDGATFSIGWLAWEMVSLIRRSVNHHQAGKTVQAGDGLPILLIQTSLPKAKQILASLQKAGGVLKLGFKSGNDPIYQQEYDLGIIETKDGGLHLAAEFLADTPIHHQAREKWERRCKQTKGWCGLVIAKGITGASKGNPGVKDMVAFYEIPVCKGEDLGPGPITSVPRQ